MESETIQELFTKFVSDGRVSGRTPNSDALNAELSKTPDVTYDVTHNGRTCKVRYREEIPAVWPSTTCEPGFWDTK